VTGPQQPDRPSEAASPIAGMTSGMGFDDDHKPEDVHPFPPHWRI
jgi:hypothetical protein